MKRRFGIVTDTVLDDGYEVQIKRWWFPFWIQANKTEGINTFKTVGDAKDWICCGCPKTYIREQIDPHGVVVEYFDTKDCE